MLALGIRGPLLLLLVAFTATPVPPAAATQSCTMTCTMGHVTLGANVTAHSSCRFRHLCATPSGSLQCYSNRRLNATPIRLSACGHADPLCDVTVSLRPADPPPDDNATVRLPGVWVLLRRWISNNWGHALRNAVLPALAALLSFRPLSAADITGPLYLGADLPNAQASEHGTAMSDALFRGFFRRPAVTLAALWAHHPEARILCFEEALLGFAAFDAEYQSVNEMLFAPPLLQLARQRAYDSFNLSALPCLRQLRVLLHLKRTKAGMRGALTHPEQVQATLQARALQYDGVPIALQTVTWTSQMTFEEQLRLVAEVDLLISDGGAAADYALFLPPGSAAILTPKLKHCAEISHPWNLLRHLGDVLVVRYPFEVADCRRATRAKDRLLGFFVDVPILPERLDPALDAAFAYILEHKPRCPADL